MLGSASDQHPDFQLLLPGLHYLLGVVELASTMQSCGTFGTMVAWTIFQSPAPATGLLDGLGRHLMMHSFVQQRDSLAAERGSTIAPVLMAPWAAAFGTSGGGPPAPGPSSSADPDGHAGALVSLPRIAALATSLHQRIVHHVGRVVVQA